MRVIVLMAAVLCAVVPQDGVGVVTGRPPHRFDLVVYGGTPGGVVTAIAAAREGLSVALVEPSGHVGGMLSGGLGAPEVCRKEVIGGYALEFFRRVGGHYGEPIAWTFEPHVAERVLGAWLDEAGVRLFARERLAERAGVIRRGTVLQALRTESGATFHARVFADATYEGDLMAQSGVTYRVGREGAGEHGESLAGVRERTADHQFTLRVSPYNPHGQLLPEIAPRSTEMAGAADRRVQAYTFRLCLTRNAASKVPFPRPPQYLASRYALLARYIAARELARGPVEVSDLMNPIEVRRGKTDTDTAGAFSTDYVGGSYEYPDGSYATRARVWQAHTEYLQGFLYFLASDPAVPDRLRRAMHAWGLCRDEFTENGHWPYQLYVREARRMVGVYVMSQKDVQTELTKSDAIGMGSCGSDSHAVQRVPTADGRAVENEGGVQVPVAPYQIPYRVMLPRRAQASNLLVPIALSATHVAYSTLRMEPQAMIAGHAAGVAAAMAVRAGRTVHDLDASRLGERLRAQGAVFVPVSAETANP